MLQSATSPASAPVDLTSKVRSIFNLYPDPTSPAWSNDSLGILSWSGGHAPWQTVIVLDLPALSPGAGYIKVLPGSSVKAPATAVNVRNINIALEILPGTGVPGTFDYFKFAQDTTTTSGNLSLLEPNNQLVVRPSQEMLDSNDFYAAVEIKMNVPFRMKNTGLPPAKTGNDLPNYIVIMDKSDLSDTYATSMKWIRDGDTITVYFTSPWQGIALAQMRFSVVIYSNAAYDFWGTQSVTSVNYYDADGQLMATSPIPETSRVLRY